MNNPDKAEKELPTVEGGSAESGGENEASNAKRVSARVTERAEADAKSRKATGRVRDKSEESQPMMRVATRKIEKKTKKEEAEDKKKLSEEEKLLMQQKVEEIYEVESEGDLEMAKKLAEEAVKGARVIQNGRRKGPNHLLYFLEVRADLLARCGDFSEGKEDYLEAVSLVAGVAGKEATLGRLFGSLGYLFEASSQVERAIDAYERGLEQLTRMREPAAVEIVRLSNNLAFIYSDREDFDEAETLFLKALKLAHTQLGSASPDTTGVCNNVGALYQKAGHYDQAREMHTMALDGRKENGESPTDIAQSHGNLAIVLAEDGDEEGAREHFEDAMELFGEAGPDFAEDFDAVCENYLLLLQNLGDEEGQERVEKIRAGGEEFSE